MGKEEEFLREYPLTAEEAFRSVSYNFLNTKGQEIQTESSVEAYKGFDLFYDKIPVGDSEQKREKDPVIAMLDQDPEDRCLPEEDPMGWIHVIDEPEKDKRYIIGFDPSEGTGGDNCAFVVRCNGEAVAVGCRNDIGTDVQALYIDAIGRWYNNATVNIERAGGGLGIINTLIRLIYPNLYGQESFDDYGSKQGRRIGFSPTQESVATILSMLRHECNVGIFKLRHPRLMTEVAWIKRITKRTKDESVRHVWRCPGKGRILRDGARISDDMFRAAALTVVPARDTEWIRELGTTEATTEEPTKASIVSIGYELHNPLYKADEEKIVVSDGVYDLIDIIPEEDDELKNTLVP